MDEIDRISRYSSDNRDKLVDHNEIKRSAQEIAHSYYANFGDCFKTTSYRSSFCYNLIGYGHLILDHVSKEYNYDRRNDIQLQTNGSSYERNLPAKAEHSIKLFVPCKLNNFLYSKNLGSPICRDNEDLDSDGTINSPLAIDDHNTNSPISKNTSNSQTRKAVSTSMHGSSTTNLPQVSQPNMEEITEFFYDEPYLPYQPPPSHELKDSPCRSIIRLDNHSSLFYCILHPDVLSYHLESIEHHIKYKNPEVHKSEILKLLDIQNLHQ
jgi:hypothetical protein